jgi:predicted transcriptional regulator
VNFSFTVEEYIKKYSVFKPATIKEDETLSKVLSYFAKGYQGIKVNRLWVTDDSNKVIGVVSQTDVMKFFRDYKNSNL